MVAGIRIDGNLAVFQLGRVDGAVLLNLTFLAAPAFFGVRYRHPLTHHAQVVQVGLDAIIGAAAYGNLEFMGQGHIMIAHIEPLVDFLGKGIGIDQAVLAGGSLAGNHRANQCPGAAGGQAAGAQKIRQRLDVFISDALNLHGQPGGHGHLTGAEPIGGLGNGPVLVGGDSAIAGDDPGVEHIGIPLVPQKAQTLDPLDVLRGQLFFFHMVLSLFLGSTAQLRSAALIPFR